VNTTFEYMLMIKLHIIIVLVYCRIL